MTSIRVVDDDVMADITNMRRNQWYGRALRVTVGRFRVSAGWTRLRRDTDPVSPLRRQALTSELHWQKATNQ